MLSQSADLKVEDRELQAVIRTKKGKRIETVISALALAD
jgi:hypothetical protein